MSRKTPTLPWVKGDPSRATRMQLKAAFKDNLLDHLAALDPNSEVTMYPLTKLVCCIGPLNSTVDDIEKLLQTGMTTVLLPMWMFNQEEKLQAIRNIREAVHSYSVLKDRVYPLGVGIDIRGPNIHTGRLVDNKPIRLESNNNITLTTRANWEEHGTATKVFIDCPDLPSLVNPGTDILLNNGKIVLNVGHADEQDITCNILKGGKLSNNTSVHSMGTMTRVKDVTQRDIDDIEFAIHMGLDFLFVSSVKSTDALKEIRKILDNRKSTMLVFAKIANKSGVKNINNIIKEADGIVLVRQSLAVELSEERLVLVQDNILATCKINGKPFYIEGYLFRSFIETGDDVVQPDIIDAMNVVQACQWGCDGFLISDTAAHNMITADVLKRLLNICASTEPTFWHSHFFKKLSSMVKPPVDPTHAIALAVVEAAVKAGAAAIIICTASGASAKMVCRYLPRVPVIAVTRFGRAARQLSLYKAAVPFHYVAPPLQDFQKDIDLRFQASIGFGKESGFIKPGDALVLLNGWRPGAGFTNTMRMTYASQTDPWVHLKNVGIQGHPSEEACKADEDCPFQNY